MKIGDMVKVLECHSIPQAVGKVGKIIINKELIIAQGKDIGKYDFVIQFEPFVVETPFGKAEVVAPPIPFRIDELEVVEAESTNGTTGIPQAFLDGMNEDEPPISAS